MKHILVPMDLLSELAEALAWELDARYPASVRSYESQDRKYQAEMEPVLMARQIIAAATAVQGEPVATIHVDGSFVHVAWRIPAPSRCAMDVYTAPQPAEQQPELCRTQPCGCVICFCENETQCMGCGAKHCGTHPVGQLPNPVYQQPAEQKPCPEVIREGAPYDDPAFESLCREYGIWGTAAAAQCAVFWEAGKRAGQQPDVAQLVEALEAAYRYMQYATESMEYGCRRNFAEIEADGDLEPEIVIVRDTLAKHRKQGGES